MGADDLLCSRNARPQKDGEGAARCPPCSQNAHGETVLVRCAQLRAALATPLKAGIGNWKALARDKARLGALRAGWVRMLRAVGIIPSTPYKVTGRCDLAGMAFFEYPASHSICDSHQFPFV